MLAINNAICRFRDKAVLSGINLQITDSSIIGLAGSSGSGKSTLLRCIQGIEKLESGSITHDGRCCFMFQDFQLFPHMSVIQNLTYAANILFKHQNNIARARDLLSRLGIGDKTDCFVHELSGGQKQRVALCRSLMIDPALLLCDEPTSGLDVATTQDVVQLLESVHSLGVNMIIASHDLDFLTKIANRIIVLKNGTICADVIPSDLQDPISALKQYY